MELVLAVVIAAFAWAQLGQVGLVLVGLCWAGWAAFAAVFWPFVPCPAPLCHKGKVKRPGKSRAYRKCTWCKGSGARVRWGRRVYDALRPRKHRRR